MEMISCRKCGKPMPKLRKEKYGYSNCVECSTELPKVAKDVTYGTGDHTWSDIIILDQETAKRIAEKEASLLNTKEPVEFLEFEDSEIPVRVRNPLIELEEDYYDQNDIPEAERGLE